MLVLVIGGIAGIGLGFWIAQTLVRVLTGVFDPPPEALVVPWQYVGALLGAAILSMGIAVAAGLGAVGRSVVFELQL